MEFSFTVKSRLAGEAEETRIAGAIPATVYGPEIEPMTVAAPYHAFEVLYRQAGAASLIDLSVEDKAEPVKVLIQDVQNDPVTGRFIHVDFRQINLKKEMQTTIVLSFVGESAAVKELGGTLIKALSVIKIKCLPQALVSHIEVDLSGLKTFANVIRARDLMAPAGITVLDNPDATIAKVAAPLTEEQLKVLEEGAGPASLEEIEVEKKGKEETAEEGEAQASAAEPADKKEKGKE